MVSITEIKSGVTLFIDNKVYTVLECQHVKPGKGSAIARVKLREVKTGLVQEKTYRGEDKIEEAYIDERKLQYLYHGDKMFHFMDQENFEEVSFSADDLGEQIHFLKDSTEVTAYFFKGEILNINLPNFMAFKIIHTEPGMKGDTAKSGTKPAEIETGYSIQVPLFIEPNDTIKVDTRTGTYIERVYV